MATIAIAARADATDQLDELIAAARPRRGAVAIILGPHPDAAATITIDTAGNATLNPLALSVRRLRRQGANLARYSRFWTDT